MAFFFELITEQRGGLMAAQLPAAAGTGGVLQRRQQFYGCVRQSDLYERAFRDGRQAVPAQAEDQGMEIFRADRFTNLLHGDLQQRRQIHFRRRGLRLTGFRGGLGFQP